MDSMKSLNSSLPSSRPSRMAPPEDLLQAFRTAALSVTNLYKSAATSQNNARQAGYQDALEDLLRFLDEENLGLQDGEGWRVRQWATARFDGAPTRADEDDVEEEPEETEVRSRDVSHEGEDAGTTQQQSEAETNTQRQASEEASEETSGSVDPPAMFHFSSTSNADSNMQTDQPSTSQNVSDPSSSSAGAPIRVELLNRNNRPNSRPHNSRHNARSNPREFTFSTGTKRKLQFPDFFDISNLNDKQDGSGGGGGSKRGRLV